MKNRLASVLSLSLLAAAMPVAAPAQIARMPNFAPGNTLPLERAIGMLKARILWCQGIIAGQRRAAQLGGDVDQQAVDEASAMIAQAQAQLVPQYNAYRAHGGHKALDRIAPLGNGMPGGGY